MQQAGVRRDVLVGEENAYAWARRRPPKTVMVLDIHVMIDVVRYIIAT